MDLNTCRMIVEGWKAVIEDSKEMPSLPGLALALGLSTQKEYDVLKEQPELTELLNQTELWMANKWFQLLVFPSKTVSGTGVQFALRTMGYTTDTKQVKAGESLHMHFHKGAEKL